MAPSEFWQLTPSEFWLIHDAKTPPTMYGRMTENEAADLLAHLEEQEAKWQTRQLQSGL